MNKKRNPQKRGGFVPIGDVADGLSLPGGRALTHRAATPQARHHFTRLDQIDQLVAASEADADLGFMARLLALCSLPRSNPGNRLQYERVNGPYKLYMIAGGGMSRALLKLSGRLVHDYATISDDSPSPNRASRARRAATSAGIS